MTGRGTQQDSNSVQSLVHPSLAIQHQFSMGNNVCSPGTHTFSASLTGDRQILANDTKVEGCWGLWKISAFSDQEDRASITTHLSQFLHMCPDAALMPGVL